MPSSNAFKGSEESAASSMGPQISEAYAPRRTPQRESPAKITVYNISPLVEPREQVCQSLQPQKIEKKKAKRATPALKVLTSRNKNFQPCQSQLSTPATDITPFHSPADPLKLNIDGPNWHLFNKKVADSLDKLAQLSIQDDKGCSLRKECSTKLELNAEGAKM